jgi:hypothetical protein
MVRRRLVLHTHPKDRTELPKAHRLDNTDHLQDSMVRHRRQVPEMARHPASTATVLRR